MATDRPTLILVDDDPLITDTLHFVLGKEFDVRVAESRLQARSLLRQMEAPPRLALVDLGLPPTPHRPDEGFKLIGELLAHAPSIKILVLSGQNDDANARHALALGAVEFIAKPCEVERLQTLLRSALRLQAAELDRAHPQPADDGLLGDSLTMQAVRSQIVQFADAPFPVLIEGESGCGKELVAAALHRKGKRRDRPYLSLNCAAISPALAESLLFGHGKGSFTGASEPHSGYFEEADAGSLLLDEVGELPPEMQAKLLRVLENGEYQRVGETQTRVSHARILAATNRDLKAEVRAGRFRADLYHRLSVFAVRVPPLREMGEDRVLLLTHFSAFYARAAGQQPFRLDAAALQLWQDYPFPGNVRELRNIAIRLTAKYPAALITEAQLAAELDLGAEHAPGAWGEAGPEVEEIYQRASAALRAKGRVALDEVLGTWEKAYVRAAMDLAHGNLSQAAKMLGINRSTLYSRMRGLP